MNAYRSPYTVTVYCCRETSPDCWVQSETEVDDEGNGYAFALELAAEEFEDDGWHIYSDDLGSNKHYCGACKSAVNTEACNATKAK